MARDQIQEVKEKTDIVSLIGEHVKLQKAGRHFKGLCPFHNEKSPSFIVSPEMQIYKCFGCGESGDSYTFLQKYEGLEFYEALKFLADRAHVTLTQTFDAKTQSRQKLYEINLLSAKFYNYVLLNAKTGKPGYDYLFKKREITKKSIDTFMLGYAPPNLSLFEYLTKKKKFSSGDLVSAGVITSYNGKFLDRFRGRVIFPIFDIRGNCISLAGRILPENDNGRVGKYINSPESEVYHKRSSLYGVNITRGDIKREGRAIVVEGELDLISSYQKEIKNVVAIKGSALTLEQATILSRICSEVVLALDSDFAGSEAATRGIGVISQLGLEMRVASFGKYKDPDEAAKSEPEFYKKSLERAIPVWDFILNSIFRSNDQKIGGTTQKLSRKLVPVLATIADRIVQAHYVKKVSDRLSVPVEAVSEELVRYENSKNTTKVENAPKVEEKPIQIEEKLSLRDLMAERLLRLILLKDPYVLKEAKYISIFSNPIQKQIVNNVLEYSKTHKEFDLSKFSQELPKELVVAFSTLLMKEVVESLDKNLEIEGALGELAMVDIKQRLNELSGKIKVLEREGKKKELKEAEKEFGVLTKKRMALDLG